VTKGRINQLTRIVWMQCDGNAHTGVEVVPLRHSGSNGEGQCRRTGRWVWMFWWMVKLLRSRMSHASMRNVGGRGGAAVAGGGGGMTAPGRAIPSDAQGWILGDVGKRGAELLKCN